MDIQVNDTATVFNGNCGEDEKCGGVGVVTNFYTFFNNITIYFAKLITLKKLLSFRKVNC